MYDSPGKLDNLTKDYLEKNPNDTEAKNLLELWNREIEKQYDKLSNLKTRFFELDYSNIPNLNPVPVTWFADPAEPTFCINKKVAKNLSDWNIIGRHNLHNEYCEYTIVWRTDVNGNLRPKRIQFTTELREYWLLLAEHSPNRLKATASSVLGQEPSWMDLYGIENPFILSEKMRRYHFAIQVAGNGQDDELKSMGVPDQPIGDLNTKNALFMTHPINGLDDLLYIVMFGARPYGVKNDDKYTKASKQQIFRHFEVEQLACRHADPAAAMTAYDQVFEGKNVAFADPIGMYIQSFNGNAFTYDIDENNKNVPIPKEWIRFSRANQRLEFGPSDSEFFYLDDIKVEEAGKDTKLTGGFQVSQFIEVGPFVLIGDTSSIGDDEYIEVSNDNSEIKCNEASVCGRIRSLETEYNKDKLYGISKISPRLLK